MTKTILAPFLLCIGIATSALLLPSPAQAQDEYSIEGVDDPTSVASPEERAADEAAAKPQDRSFLGLIKSGGWAMWPLGFMSVAVIGLAIYCFLDMGTKNFITPGLEAQLEEQFAQGYMTQAQEAAEADSSCLGATVAPLAEYLAETGYAEAEKDTHRDILAEASLDFNRNRARTINYFSVISQASPMVGLLGTVSGMIKAFANLGTKGMGDPSVLAANISEALVTTASGLVIALPAIFCYFFFRDKLNAMVAKTDKVGVNLLKLLRRSIAQSEPA